VIDETVEAPNQEEFVNTAETIKSTHSGERPVEEPSTEEEIHVEDPEDEGIDESGGYKSGSMCTYCKYCKDCAKCRHCPSCKDMGGEHCDVCKYCKYCYLCDYVCITVCKPGSFLDTFSGFVYSAIPKFKKRKTQKDNFSKEDL